MIKIFVEGRDKDFLDVYIKHLQDNKELSNDINVQINDVGGYTKLNLVKNLFKENSDAGGTNLLIFDADSEVNKGGYRVRSAYLATQKNELSIDFEQFLFPNDADEGDFETLLESIINQEHRGLIDCFLEYENCVGQYEKEDGTPKYSLPVRKSRIYTYVDAFPKSRKQKERFKRKKDFFFENLNYWNLEAEYLKVLKAFLISHIKL
jgi:hypothetical protein